MTTNHLVPGDEPAPASQDLLKLVAQQAAATAEMQLVIQQLLAERAASAPVAWGTGGRIKVAPLVEKTLRSLTTNTKRTYAGYMTFLADGDPSLVGRDGRPWTGLGDMWADEVLPSDLDDALALIKVRAARRAEYRTAQRELADRAVHETKGEGACFNAISAWRCLFEVAIRDRHLNEGLNPAAKVRKPRRNKGAVRPALPEFQYGQMVKLLSTTGDDPELDEMILRFVDVTGARRDGVLNLRLADLDQHECTARLHEKFGTSIDQPVPDVFLQELLAFARRRGACRREDKVFRKRTAQGRCADITGRRFDYLFGDRLQASYEWADRQQVTAHTLRHHAVTKVERTAGKAVAMAFARHSPGDTTDLYTRASQREVAQAVVDLHGGDHPWLHRDPQPRK